MGAMPIQCPACAVPMDEMPATPLEGPAVTVDVCSRCGGLWLDPDEIAVVVPQLEVVKAQARSLGTSVRRGTGIPACPRCYEAPLEISVLGLVVDYCTACGGLWLDGDEHTGFSQESDRMRGLAAPGPSRGAYRTAAKAAQTGIVLCSGCGSEVPLAKTYMSPNGVICPACHATAAIRQTAREVREQVTLGSPEVPMAARFRSADPRDPGPAEYRTIEERLRETPGLSEYTEGVLAILKSIDQADRCPVCGCGKYSRCGH
jgi:Zn-finger nucleic acid-binding protein